MQAPALLLRPAADLPLVLLHHLTIQMLRSSWLHLPRSFLPSSLHHQRLHQLPAQVLAATQHLLQGSPLASQTLALPC
jgi:hypothetical protein